MTLLSVNVALPKTVDIEGREYQTGIYKQHRMGRVWLRQLGLDGMGKPTARRMDGHGDWGKPTARRMADRTARSIVTGTRITGQVEAGDSIQLDGHDSGAGALPRQRPGRGTTRTAQALSPMALFGEVT